MIFKDRASAGLQLVSHLEKYKSSENTVVVGVARGGLIVAKAVAEALQLPLDLMIVRKIRAPGNEKLAIGAITEKGEEVFNENLISILSVSSDYLKREVENEKRVLRDCLSLYREHVRKQDLRGKTVLLIDDGIATGATIKAALKSIKTEQPKKILVAVPVSAADSMHAIEKKLVEVICLSKPSYFESIEAFYKSFSSITDHEVLQLLEKLYSST